MFELLALGLHRLKLKYANKLSYLNEIQLGIQHVFQSPYNGSKVRHNGANASLHVVSSVYLFNFLTQTTHRAVTFSKQYVHICSSIIDMR